MMPVNDKRSENASRTEIATLGGGCFWCLEAVFDELRGVEEVVSGYSGGIVPDPTYEQVCTGTTDHAEVVQVTFNPEAVSFREILEVYFSIHDPTTLNRQGADVGTQYRSVIFYHTPEQKRVAEEVIAQLDEAGVWDDPALHKNSGLDTSYSSSLLNKPPCLVVACNFGARPDDPIVTEVTPASAFYAAEDYHQEYFRRNRGQPYCQIVVAPKVAKFRKQHLDKLKA